MRVVFASEAFVRQAREGTQVLAGELAKHLSERHGARCFGEATESVTALGRRVPRIRALLELRSYEPDVIVYLPQNGWTWASVARALLLSAAAGRRSALNLVILQIHSLPPRWIRFATAAWSVVAATPSQRQTLGAVVKSTSLLSPRIAPDKIASVPTRAGAAEKLGFPPGHVFLHVGHPTVHRNLAAMAPLADHGLVKLVLSGYSPEEAGAIPRGPNISITQTHVENLGDYYRAASVYVFPTVDPAGVVGVPVSVFEALANGTPVVARRSDMTQRWSHLPGLYVVDDDITLCRLSVEIAEEVARRASRSSADHGFPGRLDCAGDLMPCSSDDGGL